MVRSRRVTEAPFPASRSVALLGVAALLMLTGCDGLTVTESTKAAPTSGESAPAAPAAGHTVQRGESLAGIVERNGWGDWRTVARANGITDPDTIFAGQLILPP